VLTTQDQFSGEFFMVYQWPEPLPFLVFDIHAPITTRMNQPDAHENVSIWMSPIYAVTSWFSLCSSFRVWSVGT
jgi:hypothetical protein